MRETQNICNDIKTLAKILGLRYDADDSPIEIVLALEDELEAQIDEAEDNPQELSTLMAYLHKVNTLDDRLNEIREVKDVISGVADVFAGLSKPKLEF